MVKRILFIFKLLFELLIGVFSACCGEFLFEETRTDLVLKLTAGLGTNTASQSDIRRMLANCRHSVMMGAARTWDENVGESGFGLRSGSLRTRRWLLIEMKNSKLHSILLIRDDVFSF